MRHRILALAAAATLAACAAPRVPPPPAAAPMPAPPPAAASDAAPSDDWRPLLLVRFGTPLKDVPFALGEVLAFQESPPEGAAAREDTPDAERDCFAPHGIALPRFFGQPPEEYRLCFLNDRLTRIVATVDVPAQGALARFTAACADWRGHPGEAGSTGCQGREGTTEFRASLTPGEPAAAVSIVLSDASGSP